MKDGQRKVPNTGFEKRGEKLGRFQSTAMRGGIQRLNITKWGSGRDTRKEGVWINEDFGFKKKRQGGEGENKWQIGKRGGCPKKRE